MDYPYNTSNSPIGTIIKVPTAIQSLVLALNYEHQAHSTPLTPAPGVS